jgi:phosphohistidine phosphatase
MNKQLFLFRHADAAGRALYDTDKERELTPHGIAQSHQMGVYLSHNFFTIDAIFTSTALRALQTATVVSEVLKLKDHQVHQEEELYDASVRTFLQYITKVDDEYNQVMCVGHNPTLSYLAEYLTKEAIGEMKPGGLTIITFSISSWNQVKEGNGELVRYIDPSMLEK